MIGYVAFVAVLNLALGYALAMYLQGRSWHDLRRAKKEPPDTAEPLEVFGLDGRASSGDRFEQAKAADSSELEPAECAV
jgi:hypothetical protein